VFETGKDPGAGLMKVYQVKPGEGVIIYVVLEDLDQTLAEAEDLGAKIVKEKTEIPNVGWYALSRIWTQTSSVLSKANKKENQLSGGTFFKKAPVYFRGRVKASWQPSFHFSLL
jgi:hypothetical protein